MRIVFDTNVMLSAIHFSGSVSQKFAQAASAKHELYSSAQIIDEFEEVARRDFNYSDNEVATVRIAISTLFKTVFPTEKLKVVIEDPDDDKVLECAVACAASLIVSYDGHLLKLKEFNGINIVRPEEAFALL